MYGFTHTYEELLQISGLQSLKDRREAAMLRFAQKMADNDNYRDLFPVNKSNFNTREHKFYKEENARTDRLYRSPLFTMRRLLNNTPNSDRHNDPHYTDVSHLFNDLFSQ